MMSWLSKILFSIAVFLGIAAPSATPPPLVTVPTTTPSFEFETASISYDEPKESFPNTSTKKTPSSFSVYGDNLIAIYPNGGEMFIKGKTYTIKWKAMGKVNLLLYKGNTCDSGYNKTEVCGFGYPLAKQPPTAMALNVEGGEYKWTVPNDISEADDYRIAIQDIGYLPKIDQGDGPFSISSSVCLSAQSKPNVFISTETPIITAGVPFQITIKGTSCSSLGSVWWKGESTGINDATVQNEYPRSPASSGTFPPLAINSISLDSKFSSPVFGESQKVQSYTFNSSVIISKPGTYILVAQSKNAGSGQQNSEIAKINIKVIPNLNIGSSPVPLPAKGYIKGRVYYDGDNDGVIDGLVKEDTGIVNASCPGLLLKTGSGWNWIEIQKPGQGYGQVVKYCDKEGPYFQQEVSVDDWKIYLTPPTGWEVNGTNAISITKEMFVNGTVDISFRIKKTQSSIPAILFFDVTGPSSLKVGQQGTFTADVYADTNPTNIRYAFNWDLFNVGGGPVNDPLESFYDLSGQIITRTHTFDKPGIYDVGIFAQIGDNSYSSIQKIIRVNVSN